MAATPARLPPYPPPAARAGLKSLKAEMNTNVPPLRRRAGPAARAHRVVIHQRNEGPGYPRAGAAFAAQP